MSRDRNSQLRSNHRVAMNPIEACAYPALANDFTAPASAFAMFDVATLQYLHGVANDVNTGDDVYSFGNRHERAPVAHKTAGGSAGTCQCLATKSIAACAQGNEGKRPIGC